MSDRELDGPNDQASLSDSHLLDIDKICDQFDVAWRSGEQPSIEEWLDQGKELDRARLFHSLLEIEIEYRSRAGERIDATEYVDRFPEFGDLIQRILANLDHRAGDDEPTDAMPMAGEAVGSVLGRYKLLQPLGEGGFGVVYMADQEKPVRRRVALKIIKLGMDTKQVIARFEAERQALALMDHPHISKVLDAGATHSGRPYFVMELVKGISITKYCDDNNMALDDRLRLFIEVCGAVQHAHQKGIIHRDIKPNNILVAHLDGKPVPKVIDFGIAKATDQRLTEQTIFTQLGQFIGTPAYMSPEQTQAQALDIDTRSDVYSLGVLLYELLTGTTPFDMKKTPSGAPALDEIKRIIREDEPSKPSTKLSTLGEALSTVAKRRGLEPAKLNSALRGDLDWIVMKALEKDRARRYETASAFANDIRRFLTHEPVQACPPSRRYRIAKYIRRNKGLVASLAAILFLLVTAVVGTTMGMIEARSQRDLAKDERTKAQELADRNQKVVDSFVAAFKSPDPWKKGTTYEMTAAEVLLQAGATIGQDEEMDDLTRATLLSAIGTCQFELAKLDKAIPALEKALDLRITHLGKDDPATLRSRRDLAFAYMSAGKYDQAIDEFEATLREQESTLGANHHETLLTREGLGQAFLHAVHLKKAVPHLEDNLRRVKAKFGPDHARVAISMASLAGAYHITGQPGKAVPLLEETLRLNELNFGSDNPNTIMTQHSLANAYRATRRLDNAIRLYEKANEQTQHKFGVEHPNTLMVMSDLAGAYREAGRLDEAQRLGEQATHLKKTHLGKNHPDTLHGIANLAQIYMQLGQLEEAVRLFEEAQAGMNETIGPNHYYTIQTMHYLAQAYFHANRLQDAIEMSLAVLPLMEETYGPTHSNTMNNASNLALFYQSTGSLDLALPQFEETLNRKSASLGEGHPSTNSTRLGFAQALLENRNHAKAEAVFKEVIQFTKQGDSKTLVTPRIGLAEALLGQRKRQAAADVIGLIDLDAADETRRLQARSLEASILAASDQRDKAEDLLIDSFEGLRQRLRTLKPSSRNLVARAGERVLTMYEASGETEQIAKWKKEIETVNAEIQQLRSGKRTPAENDEIDSNEVADDSEDETKSSE